MPKGHAWLYPQYTWRRDVQQNQKVNTLERSGLVFVLVMNAKEIKHNVTMHIRYNMR